MAAFTQYDVFEEVSMVLSDEDFDRWTAKKMNVYLNAGLRAIATLKPNAFATSVELMMEAGAQQNLPPENSALIRVTRNLLPVYLDDGLRAGGEAITLVTREIMDAVMPGWTDPAVQPFAAKVDHIMFDVAEPTRFYVFPGNTGGGIVEAVVCAPPARLADSSTPDIPTSYEQPVPIDESYRQALVDYVAFACLRPDMAIPAAAQRAAMHKAAFDTALGVKLTTEAIASPKTTHSPPSQ